MKYRSIISVLILILNGCSVTPPPNGPINANAGIGLVPPAPQKSRLTQDQEREIAAITVALDRHLNPKYEKAGEVVFDSATQVRVYFSDGGMHGGGLIYFEKKNGEWVFQNKFWFM